MCVNYLFVELSVDLVSGFTPSNHVSSFTVVADIKSGHLGAFRDSKTNNFVQHLGDDEGRNERKGGYSHDREDLVP